MSKPKLGFASDWIESGTGFGEVGLNLFHNLKHKYELSQLAINYSGDYHSSQREFRFYHCGGREDPYGFNKLQYYITKEDLDALCVINDAWLSDRIILKVREKFPNLPVVLYTPVDSNALNGSYVKTLNMFDRAIAYTEYGKRELQKAGLSIPCSVIGHGVDTNTFYPIDRDKARRDLGFPENYKFIVGYLAQNQPRKKVDHFIWIFNTWMRKYYHEDAAMYFHGPIVRPQGINIPWYLEYLKEQNQELGYTFDIEDKFLTTTDDPKMIVDRDSLRTIMGTWDVFVQSAANEGWAMGLHQAMAMKLATVTPRYSALAEWPIQNGVEGTHYVDILDIPNIYESGIGTDHKVFNPDQMVEALELMYQSVYYRNQVAERGYKIATSPKFNWSNIAMEFDNIFTNLLVGKLL